MITVTENAASKVKELLSQEEDSSMALRVAVRPGGCSGYSYEMFFDGEKAETDKVTDTDGVQVVVDETSAGLLVGATLDYKDGLEETGFKIDNPSAQRSCGCGKSFS